MGWDAYATKGGDWVCQTNHETWRLEIPDPTMAQAFAAADAKVMELAGEVDGLLGRGGLDISDCAHMLEKLTGVDAWGDELTPEAVQALTIREFQPEPGTEWAYHSAKVFLETCKALGLGIDYSY